jgi:hypothetical protein
MAGSAAGQPGIGYSAGDYNKWQQDQLAAMHASNAAAAERGGTVLGTAAANAYKAMGSPADTSGGSGSLSGSLGGINAALPPRIGAAGDPSTMFSEGGGAGGGGSFGSTATQTINGGQNGSGGPTQISLPDQSAAESAAFGAAKDQTGQETSGALTGLQSALAGRGMLGSGAEIGGTAAVINKGQGELGAASREQATNHLANQLDIEKANQGAAVSTRGQNMGYSATTRGQDVTQRGQDIQAQEAQAQLALTQSLQQAAQRQQILQSILNNTGQPGLY